MIFLNGGYVPTIVESAATYAAQTTVVNRRTSIPGVYNGIVDQFDTRGTPIVYARQFETEYLLPVETNKNEPLRADG